MYTFKILKNKKGEFRVQFCYRKEVIFWTEAYTRKPSAKKAIETFLKNGPTAVIEEIDENVKVVTKVAPAKKAPAKKAAVKAVPAKVAAKA